MPKHIQPSGPMGATPQRANLAGSEGRGGFPSGRRRESLAVDRHRGGFRSYP